MSNGGPAAITPRKIGLALSGGGFRASLFHIGVLARLAELDLLRHVECISCVSGGSIVGAHYYLELRKLLSGTRDADITQDDYLKLVQRLADDFLAGVQTNIRVSLAADWITNLKLAFARTSRSARLAELYEEHFYAPVLHGKGQAQDEEQKPILLRDLCIKPFDGPDNFHPRRDNPGRKNKVPMLILNATALNTGHNWQFTATWMGEPPAGIDAEIDAGYRLRRLYHKQAPETFSAVTLGQAVAASSCVPGLFEPLALENLYDGKVVRMVDGGVQDNQGAAALVEEGCTVLIVSDASGQMETEDDPSPGPVSVLLRTSSILQARVRGALYAGQVSRCEGGLLQGLSFLHMKKDLEVRPVDWRCCQDPSPPPPPYQPNTSYDILKPVQERLATMRTDLDSFSDMEAYSLMLSGYCMSARYVTADSLGFAPPPPVRHFWRFEAIRPQATRQDQAKSLLTHLSASHIQFFRVWSLVKPLDLLRKAFFIAVLAGLGWAAWTWWDAALPTPSVGGVIIWLIPLVGGAFAGKVFKVIDDLMPGHLIRKIAYGVAMASGGWLLAKLHLAVFDRLFLKVGKVK